MMKIHTTQNLISLGRKKSTDKNNIPDSEIRLHNSNILEYQNVPNFNDKFSNTISFRGKAIPKKDAEKILATAKKIVGEIQKEGKPEVLKGDKILDSNTFDKALKVSGYETAVQATIAAVVCILLRPATIMSIPSGKNKEDNIYASAHSISSGLVGLLTTLILTTPFKAGGNYVMKNIYKDIKASALQRRSPHLDIETIWKDKANNVRNDVDKWLDTSGNKFIMGTKDIDKIPKLKQLAEVSEETFKNVLGIDVNWAEQQGKSFNEIITKDGKNLYDAINMSNLGIVIKEEGMSDANILLKDMNKEYFTNFINDAKASNSNWGKLDIKTVYDDKNQVVDFRKWKDIEGKPWKLDLDEVSVSSIFETKTYLPRISGNKRLDTNEGIYKFRTYQKNGQDGKLGTEVSDEMLKADASNEAVDKFLTWLPDLAFRIPIAMTTIALIPKVLKYIFRLEKPNKTKKQNEPQITNNKEDIQKNQETNKVNFKGASKKDGNWFVRIFAKYWGKPLIESDRVAKVADKLSQKTDKLTQHMSTLGSFITSGVYMQQTLSKKDLDPERRKTLAINQGLCFLIPTAAAYTVDSMLKNWTKNKEYRYAGLKENAIQKAIYKHIDKEVIVKLQEALKNNIKGIRIISSLAVFTTIYRYITPVLITPVANKIGNWMNNRNQEKKLEQQAQI